MWRSLGKFLLVLLAFFFVSEVVLHFFFGYGRQELFRPDEELLWVPVPGHWLTVVGHQPATYNNQYFRYPVDLAAKQPGQYRIFAFGDSVTMGWAVSDGQTYSSLLEQKLNADCPPEKFQVVDAGVNAYSNSMVANRVKKVFADGYEPDLIIVGFSFNTEFEQFAQLQGANRQSLLRRVELKYWVRRSAVYDFLMEDLLRRFVYYRLRNKLMAGSWNVGSDKPPDLDYLRSNFQQSVDLARQHNAKIVFVLMGTDGQKDKLTAPQQTMLDVARANDVPVVNMFEEWKSKDHRALFVDHVHPNAIGHAEIAEDLLQIVRHIIPACASVSSSPAAAPAAMPEMSH
jgi:lysophospholipase L1-like esterase